MDQQRVVVTAEEIAVIRNLLQCVVQQHDSVENPAFLRYAPVVAHQLPERLRLAIHEFKLTERPSVLTIGGYPIDQQKLGRTPEHWNQRNGSSPAFEEEALLVLFGSLLGHPIGWSTQQDGRVVHDILPIKGHENEQLGSGCKQLLWWHTEDAFHPFRGDYICMMCLRNPDRVPTTICSVDDLNLDRRHKEILFQPRFVIRPDESHLAKNRGRQEDSMDEQLVGAYELIERMNTAPEKLAVLFGHPDAPYLRIDPYFMDRLDDDPEAQEALDALVAEVDRQIHDVALETGDFCFIDNFRAVHGRRPFQARFDGTDRWMKRINVARDLRKSRAARPTADALAIY